MVKNPDAWAANESVTLTPPVLNPLVRPRHGLDLSLPRAN